jgi:hypothetical protein
MIEHQGGEYIQAYPDHIARIRLTGIMALLVSIVGICMLVFNPG